MGLFDRLDRDGPRVAFIGIDGVPYSLIRNEPDVFENLTAMIDDCVGSAIDSVVPPESSACWPAVTTGRNPGKTGIYGFLERKPGSYETYVPRGSDVGAERVWDRVDRATVVNVPVTYPPRRELARTVSGFLSPSLQEATQPTGMADQLDKLGYRIDVDARLGHREDKTAFFADAHETLTARTAAFEWLIEIDDWDLFFGVFMTPDRVNHFAFGKYERGGPKREPFLEFYRALDESVGRVRDTLPEDVPLVVASDHGFTTLEYEFDANAWLERTGWLRYRTDHPDSLADIDGSARAYALVPGRFYLNLAGREPRGSVPADGYETVRDELREELEGLRGPRGQPVIDRVLDREEVFDGQHVDRAPDLVAIPNDGFDLKAGFDGSGSVFSTGPRNGMHTFRDATLITDRQVDLRSDPDLLDIAPLLIDLLSPANTASEAPVEGEVGGSEAPIRPKE